MAIASQSLYKMSVPGGDNAANNQGLLMPKLQFRFRVNFLNFGVDVSGGLALTKQVIDVTRPQIQFQEITMPVYNSTVYLAGRYQWNPITCNLRDDASNQISKAIGQQIQKQLDFVEQSSAASGQDYKFQTNIEILDGGNGGNAPIVLEKWELYGCFVQQANYNNLNYATNEPAQIALTIRYDNAVQSPLDSGIGADVGRIARSATEQSFVSGIGTTT